MKSRNAQRQLTLAVLLLAAFAFAPAAEAQSRDITFYGHVFGTSVSDPNPANTQYPWGEEDIATSYVPDMTCGPAAPVQVTCEDDPWQKVFLYSTAGPVTLKSRRELDYSMLHNENGMTQDIVLDTSKNVRATFFVTHSAHAWLHYSRETPCVIPTDDPPENVPCPYPYWRWHAGASPEWQVSATLMYMVFGDHGDAAGEMPPVGERWAQGEYTVVAHGEVPPTTTVHLDGYADYPRVWQFDIDLGQPILDRIPYEANVVLMFSYQNNVNGVEFGTITERVNSGEFFPVNFVMPVKNPFTIEHVYPQELYGKLVITSVINTPWGSYDIDPESVKLTIANAQGREVRAERIERVASFSVAHGGHYKPINITYVWDYRGDGLAAGKYTLTVSGSNYQHSASDELTATFEVDGKGRVFNVVPGVQAVTVDARSVQDYVADVGSGASTTESEDERSANDVIPPLAAPLVAGLVLFRNRRQSP